MRLQANRFNASLCNQLVKPSVPYVLANPARVDQMGVKLNF